MNLTNFTVVLLQTIDPQLSNYDEEGAWPYQNDEFVKYLTQNHSRLHSDLDIMIWWYKHDSCRSIEYLSLDVGIVPAPLHKADDVVWWNLLAQG